MTTVLQREVTCADCGHVQIVDEMGSTSALGPMDLDTRSAEMQRSSMWLWLKECSNCGFVSGDLTRASTAEIAALSTDEYRKSFETHGRVLLANRFHRRAILEEAEGDLIRAAWRHLHAAWTCDDMGHHEDARSFRLDVLRLFELGRQVKQELLAGLPGSAEVLLAGIARRAGMFERSRAYCESGMRVGADAIVRKLLELECRLCEARDIGCHTLGEVE